MLDPEIKNVKVKLNKVTSLQWNYLECTLRNTEVVSKQYKSWQWLQFMWNHIKSVLATMSKHPHLCQEADKHYCTNVKQMQLKYSKAKNKRVLTFFPGYYVSIRIDQSSTDSHCLPMCCCKAIWLKILSLYTSILSGKYYLNSNEVNIGSCGVFLFMSSLSDK